MADGSFFESLSHVIDLLYHGQAGAVPAALCRGLLRCFYLKSFTKDKGSRPETPAASPLFFIIHVKLMEEKERRGKDHRHNRSQAHPFQLDWTDSDGRAGEPGNHGDRREEQVF